MNGFCNVVLGGNLVRDIELRYTPGGTAIAQCAILYKRSWTDQQSGEKKEETNFIDITAFGNTAEMMGRFFFKGKSIVVMGRLKQETWDDRQTQQKRSKLVVMVEAVQFVDGGTREAQERSQKEYEERQQEQGGGQAMRGAPSAKPPAKGPGERAREAAKAENPGSFGNDAGELPLEDDVPF